jgi:hypothetical protein
MNKMSGKFYNIYIRPKPGSSLETIEEKMNLSLDWYRVDSYTWIVYSSCDAHKLLARLQPLVKPNGFLFTCELNVDNRNGWMPKALWNWLKKDRP